MLQPTDKYLLQDYRDIMRTADSPQMINTEVPIQPVVTLNSGLPKPNSKQILHYTLVQAGNTDTYFQIATTSATTNIYLVGVFAEQNTTQGCTGVLFDAASGNSPTTAGNTAFQDNAGAFVMTLPATIHTIGQYNMPYPIKMINGIRFRTGGTSQSAQFFIMWIEELK